MVIVSHKGPVSNIGTTRTVQLASHRYYSGYIQHFSKLAKFSAHCQIANDWTCWARTLTPFRLTCQVGLEVQFWPHKPEIKGSNLNRDGRNFLIFKISSANCHLAKQLNLEKCLLIDTLSNHSTILIFISQIQFSMLQHTFLSHNTCTFRKICPYLHGSYWAVHLSLEVWGNKNLLAG